MRHTPCGCRSAHLVEVQTNFLLPPVSTMRRAPAMPHSARSPPPSKRHSRLTIVRRGCKRKRIVGAHGEAMYTAPDCAARAVLQAQRRQWRGQGARPLAFSWGFKGAILSRERMAPFARFPASGGENRSPFGTQKRRDHCSVAPNFYSLRKRSAMTAAASAVDSAPVSR